MCILPFFPVFSPFLSFPFLFFPFIAFSFPSLFLFSSSFPSPSVPSPFSSPSSSPSHPLEKTVSIRHIPARNQHPSTSQNTTMGSIVVTAKPVQAPTDAAPAVTTQTVKTKSDYHVKTKIPPVHDAARVARTLVRNESLGNLALVDEHGDAVSFSEYYVDIYKSGDPYLIILNISSVNQILKKMDVKKAGFSVRTGDHPPQDKVNTHYPGGLTCSIAGSPRLIIKGELKYLVDIDPQEELKMQKEFVKRHKDAKFWLPGSSITAHKGKWAKLEINSIYFIGGFGDRAYIGNIPVDMYHEAIPYSDDEMKGYLECQQEKSAKFESLVNNYKAPGHQ